MKREDIDLFEKLYAQMEALHTEISALSKKSPNDGVNKFKLKFINKILEQVNNLLKEKYKPFDDFEIFEEDDVPTTSDVTMILSQYLNCMEKLRSDNIMFKYGNWYWLIDEKQSSIKTSPPKKLKTR